MEKELEDLSKTLLEIYTNNLQFLKNNFEDVYEDVEELTNKINDKTYTQKYSLEYRDSYFDILNLESNTWFYDTNSYDDADFRSAATNYTKDGSIDLLRRNTQTGELMGTESYSEIMPILNFISKSVDFETVEFEKIYKFIFIGTGLGIHIHEIIKKLDPFVSFIIEPDLEVFRLSLFVVDYSKFQIENRKLLLSVGRSYAKRQNVLSEFNSIHGYMNYNIKHHLFIENYSDIKQEIIEFFGINRIGSFPYKLLIENIQKTLSFIKNNEKFVDVSEVLDKKILKDKKVLIVGAGPSLDGYIKFIKNNQNKFVIICVDVIVKKLEIHNIVPDIVMSIDPSPLCAGYLTCENDNFLDNSTIVFLSQQDESVLNVVKNKHYVFSQSIMLINELGSLGSVPNVGTFAFGVSVHFGAKEIYLIGVDAAFNQETGSQYAEDSSYVVHVNFEENKDNANSLNHDDVLIVKGNLRENIKTNLRLLSFKENFESLAHNLRQTYEFDSFNLSDGANMDGFSPLSFVDFSEKIDLFDDKSFNVHKSIDTISRTVKMPNYDNDLRELNKIITRIKKIQKIRIKSKDNFLENKLELMVWILEVSKKMDTAAFGNIFIQYTNLTDIYINFMLNIKQKNIKNSEKLNKIYFIYLSGLLSMVRDFKNIYNKYN